MTTVTGGSITYARGRQPEQYGNQKAECTLSFGIADDTPGEKIAEFIMHVGDLTMVHVNRMLKVGDKVDPEALLEPTMTATEAVTGQRQPRRPRVQKDQGDPVARTPEQSVEIQKENGGQVDGDPNPFGGGGPTPAPAGGTGAAVVSTTSNAFGEQTAAVSEPPLDFNAPPVAEEITDLDLGTAMNKRAPELGPKAKELIFGLLGQFGVASGGNHRSIPQEKRAEFLEKLHALKAD